jgi:uncharacterized protein involved in exopolysaccharide biosynthesis
MDNLVGALWHDAFMFLGVLVMFAVAVPLYVFFKKRRMLP